MLAGRRFLREDKAELLSIIFLFLSLEPKYTRPFPGRLTGLPGFSF